MWYRSQGYWTGDNDDDNDDDEGDGDDEYMMFQDVECSPIKSSEVYCMHKKRDIL